MSPPPRGPAAPLRALAAAAFALAALAAARPASAYCFTYDCDPTSGRCPINEDDGCPGGSVRLSWGARCVGFWLQRDGSRQIGVDAFDPIARAAFDAWTGADCGGGRGPSIEVSLQGRVACDKQEYNQDDGNANIIMFRDDVWPYTGADNTLALTTLTFNTDTGEVYDADMEINGTSRMRLTTSDTDVDKDLLSIVTHEAGHFLGIAHTQRALHPDATMFASYDAGTITLRDLAQDDRDAICALYPAGASRGACDPTPRHGYASECGDGKSDDDGCRVAAPGRAPAPGPLPLVALAALAALARRRRAGRPARP
ncbi:MAG TPA: matrixin family metalloprotease [Polyangiaceae bacterium]|nr:matrixin family metalloprotease [Polyangiaceae bacterium]